MNGVLDNIVWHSLSGPHRKFAVGTDDIRRFAPGFSPIIGFANPDSPKLADFATFCEPGEQLYCSNWSGPVPRGWRIDEESTMFRMIWQAPMPELDEASDAVQLDPQHAEQALGLAALTRPGPFGLRTIDLGDYFGFFEDGCLVAMAGERLHAGSFREVSGVCTHPDFQGRGFARKLTSKLIRRQMQRNETPFLHVMHDNIVARGLYERLGFRVYREVPVRIISRF